MAWQAGEQVGPYQILSQLGQGGMATVYKAYHAQLDRTVAIKVMHQMLQDDETFVARFKREAQIVARLDHPHIVPVYDFNEHEKQPYLVMKYVPGVTLKQRLMKKGPLPLNEILSVITAVGSALSYAHSKGVLHRDVKPSNIVLDDDVPYLTDFGLARIAEAGESTMSADMVLGTPHYISPEQASGRKDIDGRADIYSLGVVLYELLVGRVPFTADTAYAIIHDQIYTPIPRPSIINPEIPGAVEEVLIRATEKRPDDRYSTPDDMLRELKDAIEESHLTELSPDRASVASESLAKLRSEFVGGYGVTPLPSSTIAQPVPTGSYRTATVFQSKASPHESRAWMIGGCGTFILVSLIIGGLVISSLNYIIELQQIAARTSSNGDMSAFQITLGDSFTPEMSHSELMSFLTAGGIGNTMQIFDASDPSLELLAKASELWDTDPAAAYAQIAEGKAQSSYPAQFFMLTAVTADSKKDKDAALVYVTLALYEAHKMPDKTLYDSIRPLAGKYLYETPTKRTTKDSNIFKEIVDPMYDDAEYNTIEDTPYAHFLKARVLALGSSKRLASVAANNVRDISGFEAEIRLLRGEILQSQDKMDEALILWENVIDDDNAPDWTQTLAQTYVTENNNS